MNSNADVEVFANQTYGAGGTSASAPTFAAVIALVNDALLAAGKPALGFLNPWIYSCAHKALTDITQGSSFGKRSNETWLEFEAMKKMLMSDRMWWKWISRTERLGCRHWLGNAKLQRACKASHG